MRVGLADSGPWIDALRGSELQGRSALVFLRARGTANDWSRLEWRELAVCPVCHGPLVEEMTGQLSCASCQRSFEVSRDDVPYLLAETGVPSVRILKRVGRGLWRHWRGKLRWQAQFEHRFRIALAGMNVGGGADVECSGERSVFAIGSLRRARDPVVFDVGANRGDWTRLAVSELGPRCRVYAFEPSPTAYGYLVASTKTLGEVTCFNMGLDSQPAERTLYSDVPGSGLGSVYPRRLAYLGVHLRVEETARLTKLDQAATDEGLDHIDMFKLDVEGNELAVLSGAAGMLAAHAIRVIQWEFGGCNIDSRTFLQDFWYLLSPTTDIFRIVRDGVWPVCAYRETLEQFVTTNYVAVLRGDVGARGMAGG